MTVQQLFDLTIGMMGMTTANAVTYQTPFISQVNIILSQCFNLENNVRENADITLLTAIPTVATMNDALTYQDEILRNVIVWGVAQLMALSDDDTIKAGFFGLRYSDESQRAARYIPTEVTDYYGTAEEE